LEGIMRWFLRFLIIIMATALSASSGFGQAYPSRPITLIVPYAPGGSVDAVARVIATRLGDRLGQSVVVENVAGAGGVTGTQRAARAEPDGYTLLFSVESAMVIAKLVQPSVVQYDGQKDFQPITMIGSAPLVLVGKNALPAKSLAELVTLLRANPGKYSYATSGVGTSLHLAGEMINLEGGVRMQHVPYRVGAQIITDMMGNHVDLAVLPLVMALPAHRAGNVRIFAITEPKRSPLAPELPSIAEQPELKNVNITVWFGLFAPARVPVAIAERLQQAVAAVIKEPDTRAKLDATNLLVAGSTPSEFAAFLAKEVEKYSAVVKAANIKAE
jgi:tripartite-type tricarboxylate transporter receptor subunit TctC